MDGDCENHVRQRARERVGERVVGGDHFKIRLGTRLGGEAGNSQEVKWKPRSAPISSYGAPQYFPYEATKARKLWLGCLCMSLPGT